MKQWKQYLSYSAGWKQPGFSGLDQLDEEIRVMDEEGS